MKSPAFVTDAPNPKPCPLGVSTNCGRRKNVANVLDVGQSRRDERLHQGVRDPAEREDGERAVRMLSDDLAGQRVRRQPDPPDPTRRRG
jgi:hypothetical protein